ncbi:MAG: ligase-associated DNA damage response endonuclease PdeM [Hyphomicrobiaceae bacterium]|nr:ligase-associated DNA damage response endonuclease PdeM [Hyphomicrobiaceae bacterium]
MLGLRPERLALDDFKTQPISICGKPFVADQSGALYWPPERTLIVADLHLEKGSAHASRGLMLPPYDTRQTLLRLAQVIDRLEADTVIALGDSLHDTKAAERISAEDLEILRIIQQDRRWVWVTGNHDPVIGDCFGGERTEEIALAGIALRHEPRLGRITHEIAGHLHPAARISIYGTSLRRPCFLGNGLRLILPAFGAFTGGLNVLDDAFLPLFDDDGLAVWMLGEEGLYPIAARLLRRD